MHDSDSTVKLVAPRRPVRQRLQLNFNDADGGGRLSNERARIVAQRSAGLQLTAPRLAGEKHPAMGAEVVPAGSPADFQVSRNRPCGNRAAVGQFDAVGGDDLTVVKLVRTDQGSGGHQNVAFNEREIVVGLSAGSMMATACTSSNPLLMSWIMAVSPTNRRTDRHAGSTARPPGHGPPATGRPQTRFCVLSGC